MVPTFPLSIRHRRAAAAALLLLVVVVVALRHQAHGGNDAAPVKVAPIVPTAEAASGVETGGGGLGSDAGSGRARLLVVDVAGAVRRPGLYRLPQGARVADAVARAGGLARHADSTLINLAAPLADGEQVLVSAQGGGGGAVAAGGASPSAPVRLNSAGTEELDSLPGVGPVTAEKIVAYRQQHGPFTSLDGLDAIPGIGPARIASLKGLAVP